MKDVPVSEHWAAAWNAGHQVFPHCSRVGSSFCSHLFWLSYRDVTDLHSETHDRPRDWTADNPFFTHSADLWQFCSSIDYLTHIVHKLGLILSFKMITLVILGYALSTKIVLGGISGLLAMSNVQANCLLLTWTFILKNPHFTTSPDFPEGVCSKWILFRNTWCVSKLQELTYKNKNFKVDLDYSGCFEKACYIYVYEIQHYN